MTINANRSKTITISAVIGRLNRKLARDGEVLRKTRGDRWRGDLGDYYVVNDRNAIVGQHVDPEAWARELGVLQPTEAVLG